MTFRDEVFKLCKVMEKESITLKLREQIIELRNGPKSMLTSSGINRSSHYLGILLLDEQVDFSDSNIMLSVMHKLTLKEREMISIAHCILINFVNECLNSIPDIPVNIKLALNPYLKFKPLNSSVKIEIADYIDVGIFSEVVEAFINTKIVGLFHIELKKHLAELNQINAIEMNALLTIIEREIDEVGFNQIPASFSELAQSRSIGSPRENNSLFAFFYLCFCLQSVLKVCLDMLAMVFNGEKMGVIDEDSIININKCFSNLLRKGKEFLLQESNKPSPEVAKICVLDYSIKANNINVHEFGYCIATTTSFSSEYGNTLKCKVNIVDEDLNQYEMLKYLYSSI